MTPADVKTFLLEDQKVGTTVLWIGC